jgi:hypothetical protein
MNDMTAVIAPKSDQINADDLIAGPRTILIAGVSINPGGEQPVAIAIDGDRKVFRPCKSMSRVLVAAWGPDTSIYSGRSLTLYRDPKVKWGGLEVGGIRISEMTNIDRALTMALSESKAVRKPFTVKPLVVRERAAPATDPFAAVDAEPTELSPEIQKWFDVTLAAIERAADREHLAGVQTRRAAGLASLREGAPDRAAEIDAAIVARLAALDEPDDAA